MPHYREDLDSQGCSSPGCDHKNHQDDKGIFLHAACHMGAGVEANYRKGELIINCNKCKKHVATIAVATRSITN